MGDSRRFMMQHVDGGGEGLKSSPTRETARSRHRDYEQPLIYILSTVEAALCFCLFFGMPKRGAARGAGKAKASSFR